MSKINPSRAGDIAEHKAVIWLADQGYEVFRNCIRVGPIDIVAIDKETGETILIDVKSTPKGLPVRMKWHYNRQDQKKLGVRYLMVHPDNGCFWACQKDIG